MTQTLLMLGAGPYQVAGIQTARALGLRVVAVDANPAAPGLALADVARAVDVRDVAGCIAVAKEQAVDGVVAICVECGVTTAAAVAAELGLPGLSRDAALAATDKYVMRTRLAAAGIAGPAFRQACTVGEATTAGRELGYPVVIKPVDNAGSRGVRRLESEASLPAACGAALAASTKGQVIMEEFMAGTEATVESFTVDGVTQVLAVSDKVHAPFPACVSTRLNYPGQFPDEVHDDIRRLISQAAAALGIDRGPTHAEVMVRPEGVRLVELAARGGGYRIFQEIVPLVSGVDITHETIKAALGQRPEIHPRWSRAAVLWFFHPEPYGTLAGVDGVEQAKASEGIVTVVIEVAPGEPIVPIMSDGDRPGYLIATGATRAQALERAQAAAALVRFEIRAGVSV